MKPRRAPGIVLSALAAIWIATTAAGETRRFEGEARVSLKSSTLRDARSEAVKLARREALRAAIAAVVPTAAREKFARGLESRIVGRDREFVLSYAMIADGPDGDDYRIRIDALIDVDKLLAAVRELGREGGAPSSVLVLSAVEGRSGWERDARIEKPIAERLAGSGFAVADEKTSALFAQGPEYEEAAKERFRGLAEAADVVGVRRLVFIRGFPEKEKGAPLSTITVFVQDLGRRTALAQFGYRFADPLDEGAFATDLGVIADKCVGFLSREDEGGSETAADDAWAIVFHEIAEYRPIATVKKALEREPGVSEVALDSFGTGGTARLTLKFRGNADDLAALVLKIEDPKVKLRRLPGPAGEVHFEVGR